MFMCQTKYTSVMKLICSGQQLFSCTYKLECLTLAILSNRVFSFSLQYEEVLMMFCEYKPAALLYYDLSKIDILW